MADYIYLLENRLSAAQQSAIRNVRDVARAHELTIFLTGGAVRDLTAGSAVRDLDLTVVGETAPLRKQIETAGAIFTGENTAAKALYFLFPGGVRVEVSSAVSVEFPKPGKPNYTASGIIDDLRRRDFTANAMALSLNEGSYGLLMDPVNGVADIENRELRLISNYGFIEDPTRMVRAVRLMARLGWQLEERTRQRYDNAKAEDLLGSAPRFATGYELEEIFYEEDPLRVMRALDAEGWLKLLSPQLAAAKPNETALAELRERQGELLTQGVLADASTLALPLVLGKTSAADIAMLKKSFARSGFAKQVDSLEARTRELQTRFSGKEAATPSFAWRLLHEAEPELVLSMLFSGKGAVQQRLKIFLQDSPTARQRIPYTILQEMRITPDLPIYNELLDKLFYELMDGKLGTPEEMKAYLEPFSPPAPPPPPNLRRPRAKKEARPSRAKAKKAAQTVAQQEEAVGVAEGLMQPGTLTGPGRGSEPSPATPLEGKVAPLAAGESEPTSRRGAKPVKAAASAVKEVSAKSPGKATLAAATPAKTPVKAAQAKKPAKKGAPPKSAAKKLIPSKKLAAAAGKATTRPASANPKNQAPLKKASKTAPKAASKSSKAYTKSAKKAVGKDARTQPRKSPSKAGPKRSQGKAVAKKTVVKPTAKKTAAKKAPKPPAKKAAKKAVKKSARR